MSSDISETDYLNLHDFYISPCNSHKIYTPIFEDQIPKKYEDLEAFLCNIVMDIYIACYRDESLVMDITLFKSFKHFIQIISNICERENYESPELTVIDHDINEVKKHIKHVLRHTTVDKQRLMYRIKKELTDYFSTNPNVVIHALNQQHIKNEYKKTKGGLDRLQKILLKIPGPDALSIIPLKRQNAMSVESCEMMTYR